MTVLCSPTQVHPCVCWNEVQKTIRAVWFEVRCVSLLYNVVIVHSLLVACRH